MVDTEPSHVNRVLEMLSQRSPASDVAREVGVSRQAVYKVAAHGEARGIIERVSGTRPLQWRAGPNPPSSPLGSGTRFRTVNVWIGPRSTFGTVPKSTTGDLPG